MDYNFSKLLRIHSGYSQENLAHRMGIVRPYLSRCEQSDKQLSYKIMKKLANACDVSVESLFLAVTEAPKELNDEEKELYSTLRSILRMRIISKTEKTRLAAGLRKVA
jgi:transcriptional regulator with XRE-family HTH domain